MQQCPKCNYELTLAERTASEGKCPSCGIYFAKYQAQLEAEPATSNAASSPPPDTPAKPVGALTKSVQDFRGLPIRGPVPVVVTDVEMRFGSMVVFMVKWVLAAIPALIILAALAVFLFIMMGAMFASAHAQQVYRCVDDGGNVTFSQMACPDGLAGDEVRTTNTPPSNGDDYVPWGEVSLRPAVTKEETPRVTVVGGQKECSDASAQRVRTAVVQKKVFVGMTAEQATRSWGKPLRINRSSHGSDQWVYNSMNLYIEDGCVVSWN